MRLIGLSTGTFTAGTNGNGRHPIFEGVDPFTRQHVGWYFVVDGPTDSGLEIAIEPDDPEVVGWKGRAKHCDEPLPERDQLLLDRLRSNTIDLGQSTERIDKIERQNRLLYNLVQREALQETA